MHHYRMNAKIVCETCMCAAKFIQLMMRAQERSVNNKQERDGEQNRPRRRIMTIVWKYEAKNDLM